MKHIGSDILALVSLTSGGWAWVGQLDTALRILASIVAILAGGVALYQRLKTHTTPPVE